MFSLDALFWHEKFLNKRLFIQQLNIYVGQKRFKRRKNKLKRKEKSEKKKREGGWKVYKSAFFIQLIIKLIIMSKITSK